MLEGLVVWTLFIYLLRMIGMPWNKFSKLFAYIGGGAWLLFVWVGLITYRSVPLSGGSVVQSPHIQLRPATTKITGNIKTIYVKSIAHKPHIYLRKMMFRSVSRNNLSRKNKSLLMKANKLK